MGKPYLARRRPADVPSEIIEEKDVPIPMRDGVFLRANVFRPDSAGRFPGILLRTPYGKKEGGYERYVEAGYVVVVQDTRGRYASDGVFVPFYVEHTGDAEDGYDTVEWLAVQPYCNGRVGTMGASYCSWMQWALAKLRPPHLRAMCAYTIPVELDQLDRSGIFRPARRIHWWMHSMAPDIRRRTGEPAERGEEALRVWNQIEASRWLRFLPWLDIPLYLPKGLSKYVEDWLLHPGRKPWRFAEAHSQIEVPNLDFAGWYDHCWATIGHLSGMQANARTSLARTQTKLMIGPWNHVGPGLRRFGEIDFGPEAEVDIHGLIIRWFDHWLKGLDNGVEADPAVRYFVMGSGKWKSCSTWPPEASRMTYFLRSKGDALDVRGSGRLEAGEPGDDPPDAYTYDPRDPVPTLWDRSLFTVPSDRRLLEHRSDILYFRTEPLAQEIEIAGHPELVMYASSSARDTDFFSRLVDEIPAGPALDICQGAIRARHRNSPDRKELLEPGRIVEYRIVMGPTACRFPMDHRIRLEITSSDFPNYDRNHNTGGNDLAETKMETAEQQIHHSSTYPSRLVLPVSPYP